VGQLGTMLRTAREEKGVSLAQVEAAIMIKKSYLQALEDDEHAILPGAVYVKGFLRNYAVYLGLDPTHVLSVYHREYPEGSQMLVAPAPIKPRSTNQLVTGGTLASLLLVVVAAVLSTYVYRQVKLFKQGEPALQAAAQVPTPTPVQPTATSQPAAPFAAVLVRSTPVPNAATPTPVASGAEVTAKILQDAWFQVEVDGRRSFEGTLKAGQTQTWKGKDEVFLWIGNAGGVSIVFNGRDIGTLGASGEVVKKDFKKD
jgi:cytoskeletal protein RodZ